MSRAAALSLHRRAHPLAGAEAQRERLDRVLPSGTFTSHLETAGLWPLRSRSVDTLQINVGRRCNQTCAHCHVDAGPDRPEVMGDRIVEACLELLLATPIRTLDVTGGAPELHPRFREIVVRAAEGGRRVLHRCNLTAIRLPAHRDVPELLARHRVEIIASLPTYLARQTDRQRGEGVFDDSLAALRELNELGYGRPGGGLVLNLVTNPVGAYLPGSQASLERDFRRELERRHGVVFDRLFTITNMPISRFLEFLDESGNLEAYLTRLVNAFNPAAAENVMCRDLVSVGHDGRLYDCDFNQMLDAPVETGLSVVDAPPADLIERLARRRVSVGNHCFGCTAGAGSSCGGTVA